MAPSCSRSSYMTMLIAPSQTTAATAAGSARLGTSTDHHARSVGAVTSSVAIADLHAIEEVIEALHAQPGGEPERRVRRPDQPAPVRWLALDAARTGVVPRHFAGRLPQQF